MSLTLICSLAAGGGTLPHIVPASIPVLWIPVATLPTPLPVHLVIIVELIVTVCDAQKVKKF